MGEEYLLFFTQQSGTLVTWDVSQEGLRANIQLLPRMARLKPNRAKWRYVSGLKWKQPGPCCGDDSMRHCPITVNKSGLTDSDPTRFLRVSDNQ